MSFPAQSNYRPFDGPTTDTDQIITCPGATRLQVQIANQPIYITFGSGQTDAIMWDPYPEPFLPVVGTIRRRFDAIKVRSKVPGNPAIATLTPLA